jgi:putative DNA primase/helicase
LAHRLSHYDLRIRIAVPDLNGDTWSDALSAAGTNLKKLGRLRDALLKAEPFEPTDDVRSLPANDFVNLVFPIQEMLCGPWLLTRSLVMIHAERGGAKTWLALAVAHAVATGRPLMDWQNERPGKVLYIDGELPGEVVQDRLGKFGGSQSDLSNLHILTPDLLERRNQYMPDLGTPEGREAIDKIIERGQFDLIVLDSLSTLVRSGVENDAAAWVPLQDWALRHRGRGRTIIFVHHDNRKGKPRGSSKREDVLDAMIGLTPQPGLSQNDLSFHDLEFTKHRRFFGTDAAPRRLSLSTASGTVEWMRLAPLPSQYDQVVKLKQQGMKQVQIAKKLGVSAGRITQILSEGDPSS